MTAKAAAAFAAYVALGDARSLVKLAETEGVPKVGQLKKWSAEYDWPARIAEQEEAEAAAIIRRVARRKAAIYERTVAEYDKRTVWIDAMTLGDIHGVHDRVKPADPAANASAAGTVVIVIGERADGPQ